MDMRGSISFLLIARAIKLPLIHMIQVLGTKSGLVRLFDVFNTILRVADEIEELMRENHRSCRLFPLLKRLKVTIGASAVVSNCLLFDDR